jgi:thiol-disulfide isomerase/thioredoxin
MTFLLIVIFSSMTFSAEPPSLPWTKISTNFEEKFHVPGTPQIDGNKKIVAVVLWASWCGYCKGLIKELSAKPYPDVSIVTINLDLKKNEIAKAVKDNLHGGFAVYLNQEDYRQFRRIPVTFIYDKERRLKELVQGAGEQKIKFILNHLEQ